LTEGIGINLDHGGLGEGVRADEFVVGGVEGDGNDTDFAGDALTAPGEVAGVEAQGAEFAVAAAGADEMDTLGADTGVGRLATFLEGPVFSSECDGWQCDRVMHTSSCDSMRALHRRRCACDASHERYCDIVSHCVIEWNRGGGRRLYPMVAVGEGHCEENVLALNVL
jgi:hypothetical protein